METDEKLNNFDEWEFYCEFCNVNFSNESQYLFQFKFITN
jgi:hypothetical protein